MVASASGWRKKLSWRNVVAVLLYGIIGGLAAEALYSRTHNSTSEPPPWVPSELRSKAIDLHQQMEEDYQKRLRAMLLEHHKEEFLKKLQEEFRQEHEKQLSTCQSRQAD
jgi:hypothetical protein